jgi:hypothetical protein
MEQLTGQLSTAADTLTTVDRVLPTLAVPAGAFAADDVGVPGRLGHQLHAHWSAVLAARAQEAAEAAIRLKDLAAALQETRHDYDDIDGAAGHRITRSGEGFA